MYILHNTLTRIHSSNSSHRRRTRWPMTAQPLPPSSPAHQHRERQERRSRVQLHGPPHGSQAPSTASSTSSRPTPKRSPPQPRSSRSRRSSRMGTSTSATSSRKPWRRSQGRHHRQGRPDHRGRDRNHEMDAFDRGFISPYFVTDVKSQKVGSKTVYLAERVEGIPAAGYIVARGRRPTEETVGHHREDIDGEALATCILNKIRGQLQVAAVKAPGFGDNRKSILGSLAILTGGTVFTEELDIQLERATTDLLGSTGSITTTKEDTIVLNGEGSKDSIQAAANRSGASSPTRRRASSTRRGCRNELLTDT